MKFLQSIQSFIKKPFRRRAERRADNRVKKHFWKNKKFWNWTVRVIAIGMALVAFLFIWYAKDLPNPNKLLERSVPESTKIYARDGTTLLYEVHGEYKRSLIGSDQINDNVKNATIAIEDKDFYNESGINFKGIARSIYVDFVRGGKAQGGSTITQQFVRNAMLSREKTISRKVKEIILSLEINKLYSKEDIIRLYLNEIPYGRNAYGIEAASRIYFDKHAKDLDLAEAAYMAALPQAPSFYNPTGPHRDALDSRKNLVLQKMFEQGYITADQRDQAQNETVTFKQGSDPITAPHFVMYIEDYLSEKYGEQTVETGGLNVITTLDPKLQEIAEKAVTDGAAKNKSRNGYNAALVAVDPKTGQILAMVGSKDYFGDPEPAGCKPGVNCKFDPHVNVAIAERQPGSSGKPYVYATAFKPQFKASPASLRLDVETNFGTYGGKAYIPHNYNGGQYGPVSIRQALSGSLNIPAVKTLDLVGVDNAIATMRDFGISSPLKDCGLSLVLGGCEVKLVDHVGGFATFAAGGVYHPVTGIMKVSNQQQTLEEFKDDSKEVLDPQAAYEVTSILSDYEARKFIFGASASNLELPDRKVAAKTGTTQSNRDGWTLGYTPSLAAGVWTGNNNGDFMNTDAVITAGPIWKQFMSQALAGTPAEDFAEPSGIQHVVVDSVSGLLPTQYTPNTKTEVFADYAVPTEHDNVHVPVERAQNSVTPVLNPDGSISPETNTTYVSSVCTVLHSERPTNPNWENPVIAWSLAHGYCYPSNGRVEQPNPTPPSDQNNPQPDQGSNNPPSASIISPTNGSTVSTPFILKSAVLPAPGNTIDHVDLLIDGSLVDTMKKGPYYFNINETLGPGSHTFAIHAVDNKGNENGSSITLIFK